MYVRALGSLEFPVYNTQRVRERALATVMVFSPIGSPAGQGPPGAWQCCSFGGVN